MSSKATFECTYCGKAFKSEAYFMRHECNEMKKSKTLRSIEGARAYEFYSHWMRCNKRSVPSIQAFGDSRYFSSFIRFEQYAREMELYKPLRFIELMTEKDISPMLWQKNEAYVIYSSWLDRVFDPIEQSTTTTETIFQLAEIFNCQTSEVFSKLQPAELIRLIRQRKLSMFLLLRSKKFQECVENMQVSHQQEILKISNTGYYHDRFKANPALAPQLAEIAKALGI